MLHCPKCQGRLPIAESIGLHGAILCPHCSSELKLNRWVQFLELIVLMAAIRLCNSLLRATGISVLPAYLAAAGISVIVTMLLHISFARYHLKPPAQSITRTDQDFNVGRPVSGNPTAEDKGFTRRK